MAIDSWTNTIDWSTPAGIALKRLISELPRDREFLITLFGSAPIQITIEPTLLSSNVDLVCDEEDLNQYVRRAGLAQGEKDFYIQVCSGLNFRTSPLWIDRAKTVRVENCTLRLPHPIDILIAKLNRLDEKDLEAFRVVMRKTGHPTEAELIHELQMAVDLFRPSFDEEQNHDMADNCRRLWPIVYGREIDPRKEIIAPALQKRRDGYGELPAITNRNYGTPCVPTGSVPPPTANRFFICLASLCCVTSLNSPVLRFPPALYTVRP